MWLKKKKKLDDLSKDAINALNTLKRKKFTSESLENLDEILRIFLKEKYKFSRSLTVEEILKKLKTKKTNKQTKLEIAYILERIYGVEYKSKDSLTKKQFNELIIETKAFIKKSS